MQYYSFITDSLNHAANIAVTRFNRSSVKTKTTDNNQVLTEADIAVAKLLTDSIKREFSLHNIIDEELGVIDNHSDYTWIIDPIDGTSNFAAGVPMYGIMIGLLHEGTPIAGGIILPAFKELYIAEKGQGAFCNGKKIQVTNEAHLDSQLIAYGIDGHRENPGKTREETRILTNLILGIRNLRMSNSCYDAILVAQGKYGGYINQTQGIWDNVPQHILIEEAGGTVSDYYGKTLDYTDPLTKWDRNFTICAASSSLHKTLLDIIASV